MLTAVSGNATAADVNGTIPPGNCATVAVVIPTFNHAHFLAEALRSVLDQTRQADEIIVIDDGSTDDPAAVVAKFQRVRLIRQDNRGLSAARNTGLRSCTTSHVVFLDADDRLLPTALEVGLSCIAARPDCAFVHGRHRLISEDGNPIGFDLDNPIDDDARLAFLRGDPIAIHTVLFRRDCLLAVNGFDETLLRCEDYDLHLRIVQRYPIASHPTVIAEYRRHGQNMSSAHLEQFKTVLRLLDRYQSGFSTDALTRTALREGRARKRSYFVSQMLAAASARWRARHSIRALVEDFIKIVRWSPYLAMRAPLAYLGRSAIKVLPRPIVRWIERIRGRSYPIPIGSVSFGDLRRLSPISRGFGWDRGTPIDRHYVESFLARNANDIRGRVLEAGNNLYTRRFGDTRVERSDVVSVETNNPHATIVGDLAQPGLLPEAVFDCIVLTQTLQFIFDVRAALATSYRALKPGGVMLLTTPGVSKMHDAWPWYWTFTAAALRRLLEDQFGNDDVSVETHGNVLVATAFLHGIATEELDSSDLNAHDPSYPIVVAARVVKRKDA